MTRIYVSLDLETTGLNPKTDRITEIGAVRFRGDRVLDEFHSLINPGKNIPYQIQHLTGISNRMVANAPRFADIRADLQRFVADSPVIGHNVQFDLGFLRNLGLFERNSGIDTFEIASILLPHASRYSLKSLAALLDVAEPPTHRALDDARVTHRLFEALLDQARRLDGQVIKEVAEMASRSKWSLAPVFKDLARERSRSFSSALGQQLTAKRHVATEDIPPLKPIIPPRPLDIPTLSALIQEGGAFDKVFPKFEHRPQQVSMLETVADAFNEAYHLMVEAGTGTGKSLAYLIPAVQWAVQNNTRVVISTNTINLQDQIINKDLPDLKKILKLDARGTTLKGRGNYVCAWRVEQLRRKAHLSPLELRLLAKILVWMPNTLTGDKQELFIPNRKEQYLWQQVNANADICPPERCARQGCFFARARQTAESAHVIVVNHALLLADIAVNNRAIPEYDYLIIDEAHHLEDSITNQLGYSATKSSVEQLLKDLSGSKTGLFAEIARRVNKAGLGNAIGQAESLSQAGQQAAEKSISAWRALFNVLDSVLNEFLGQPKNQYDRKLRITPGLRVQPAWSDIEMAWDNTNLTLGEVVKLIIKAGKFWDNLDSYEVDNWEDMLAAITNYKQQLDEARGQLDLILREGDPDTITWIEQSARSQDISLHAAPLHVGNLVRRHLLESKKSVIFTSATLRTDNSFEYLKERLSAWDVGEIAVGSPFDYANNALVYIPTDIPEPGAPNFQKAFAKTLADLAIALEGRTLVLFTAYSHLRSAAQLIQQPLADHDIALYQQGSGASRRQLLDNFKNTDKAVLLGTRSFWEGIDIPGPDLSCVVIAKIPFAVPSDPIVQARNETFEDAFNQYSVPEAILHFRQGFGRLIRSKTDQGVVVIMDKRVLTKRYGESILDSLPEATIQRGLASDLPAIAKEWVESF